MSAQPAVPVPTTVPSPYATTAMVFVFPPSTPSSRSPMSGSGGEEAFWQVRVMGGGERVVDPLGHVRVDHERVGAERPQGIASAAAPRGLGGESLVFAEHLDESTHMPRQGGCRQHVDAA